MDFRSFAVVVVVVVSCASGEQQCPSGACRGGQCHWWRGIDVYGWQVALESGYRCVCPPGTSGPDCQTKDAVAQFCNVHSKDAKSSETDRVQQDMCLCEILLAGKVHHIKVNGDSCDGVEHEIKKNEDSWLVRKQQDLNTLGNDRCSCFHGDTTVRTRQGEINIKQLSIGDEVLTVTADGDVQFDKVFGDAHSDKNKMAAFIKIETEGGKQLSVTPLHYVQIGDSLATARLVAAKEVKVGDLVMTWTSGLNVSTDRVTNTRRFTDKGIFNPLTEKGSILANDVVASVYADDIQPVTSRAAHLLLWPLRVLPLGGLVFPDQPGSADMPVLFDVLNNIRESLL